MRCLVSPPKSLFHGVILMDKVVVQGNETTPSDAHFNNASLPRKEASMDQSRASTVPMDSSSSAGEQDSLEDTFQLSNASLTYDQPAWNSMSDQDLLLGVEDAAERDKLVLVSQYLREMEKRNLTLSDPKQHATLAKHVRLVEEVIQENQTTSENGGWKKHCVLHGKQRNSILYSRVNEKKEISIRAETPMEASLLIPFLSVVNETDLYTSWIPSFQRPVRAGM